MAGLANTHEVDLGEFKEKEKATGVLQADKDKTIRDVKGSCGCLKILSNKTDNTVVFSFAGSKIDKRLTQMVSVKSITVYYTDDTYDIFKIKSKFVR